MALQDYIQDRQAQEDNNKGRFYQKGEHHYATFFGRMADLPRIDGRAYSGKAKCQAAQKMMTALKGGEATFFNDDIVALEQGRLGKMTAALKAADLLPEAFNQAKEANTWGSWLKMKVANMCGGR
ncbi:MAG: hypothetical protein DHS20C10_06680 [marine bacterium B5-7]|nr:MAG: hypothetical protein DHS20C10_06680 [marine bacterium B5-7]